MFVGWDWRRPSRKAKHKVFFRGRIEIVDPGTGQMSVPTHRPDEKVPLCDVVSYVLTDGRGIFADDETLYG